MDKCKNVDVFSIGQFKFRELVDSNIQEEGVIEKCARRCNGNNVTSNKLELNAKIFGAVEGECNKSYGIIFPVFLKNTGIIIVIRRVSSINGKLGTIKSNEFGFIALKSK